MESARLTCATVRAKSATGRLDRKDVLREEASTCGNDGSEDFEIPKYLREVWGAIDLFEIPRSCCIPIQIICVSLRPHR